VAEDNLTSGREIVRDRRYQNIVTSYVSSDIFDSTHWLKGSTYLYLIEQFDYLPRLKVNITDPLQRLVPGLNGNLNFLASPHEDYWYLNIRLPHWERGEYFPVLVYSWDITSLCRYVENLEEPPENAESLFEDLHSNLELNSRSMERPPEIPYKTFPYYEGVNRMGFDKYWLGLYWRNNLYDLPFLKELCGFCLDNSIGKICITPWKSLIIKGIYESARPALERMLGQRGINVRHSQLEMNWHLPVADPGALQLKNYLVGVFHERDISTYGLTFGISNDVGKRTHFAAIIIEKNPVPGTASGALFRPSYNILYSKNFDPNSCRYIPFAQDVGREVLPDLLIELSRMYFGQQDQEEPKARQPRPDAGEFNLRHVYQCPSCLTIYDPVSGDPDSGIAPGTPFEELPANHSCTVCSADGSIFQPLELSITEK